MVIAGEEGEGQIMSGEEDDGASEEDVMTPVSLCHKLKLSSSACRSPSPNPQS